MEARMLSEEWPVGTFRTIVADPPWKHSDFRLQGQKGKGHKGPEAQYRCMTVEAIKSLPVNELADTGGCHLYLWTTALALRHAFEVVDAWGFDCRNVVTWCKPGLGTGVFFRKKGMPKGGYYRSTTEFILFGVMGRIPLTRTDCRTHFTWTVERKRHSKKPDGFFDLVSKVSPGPFCELFARDVRPSWVQWNKELRP
jgi:N6-adenosine-specific RNA methylase IME4